MPTPIAPTPNALDPAQAAHWTQQSFAGRSGRDWLVAVLLLVLGFLVGRLVAYLLARYVPKLTEKTETKLDDLLLERLSRPVAILVFLGFAHLATIVLELIGRPAQLVGSGLVMAAAMVVGVMLLRAIDVVFSEAMQPWANRQTPPVNPSVVSFSRISSKVVIVLLLAVTVLQRAGFDVLSVITGLGIGGLAVALAAQETLGNLLGSLQIMTDRPFTIGDWIKYGEYNGQVMEIGMRSTRLQLSNGVRVVVPNKKLAETWVENYSHANGTVRDFTLRLPLPTPADHLEQAVAAVREVLSQTEGVHPEFSARFASIAADALEIRVVYKCALPASSGVVAETVNTQILRRIQALDLHFTPPARLILPAVAPKDAPLGMPPTS